MDWVDVIRTTHVLGACVLIGTGAGIAFFMLMAHRTADPSFVAQTAAVVVVADMIFTMTAAIAQPLTGVFLMRDIGWSLSDGWLAVSLGLYVFIGLFWLPVVYIQAKMRDEARACVQAGVPLSPRYKRLRFPRVYRNYCTAMADDQSPPDCHLIHCGQSTKPTLCFDQHPCLQVQYSSTLETHNPELIGRIKSRMMLLWLQLAQVAAALERHQKTSRSGALRPSRSAATFGAT